jgi:hypothetical protein
VRIELTPTLDHCIETTAKQEFARYSDEYLGKGIEDKDLEERIELLRMFLETMDFKVLRSESEKHLVEGRTVRFTIYLEDGEVRYKITVDG